MNVKPVSSPHQVMTTQSNPTAKRTAAIEAFNKGQSSYEQKSQAQEHPVADPNNISPEEISAVRPSQPVEKPDSPATTEDTQAEVKPAKDPALERQFQQLARQERQLRAKVKAEMDSIAAQKAEIAKQQEAIKAKETEYTQGYISKDQLKRDTYRILEEAGVQPETLYTEMTDRLLGKGPDPRVEAHIRALESKIQQLEEKTSNGEKAQAESQQQAYKAAIKQIDMDVKQEVSSNPNEYKHILATKSQRDVTELIEATYKEEDRVMSVEEAAKEVETYLKDEYQRLKGRLEPAGQPAKVEAMLQKQQTQPSMKTLTNAASSTRKLSAKERAILAFKGELKQ